MADWVYATTANGDQVLINLDLVATIKANPKGGANLRFVANASGEHQGAYTLLIQETPEHLVRSARRP